MKNNILWAVLLVNLLSLASVLGYVAARPAHALAFGVSGDGITHALMLAAERLEGEATSPEEARTSRTVAQTSSPPPRSESSSPPPRSTTTTGPPPRRADAEETANRPPPRRETDDARRAISVARHRGDIREAITTIQPPPEMYPFTIERRTYPEPGVMQVDMLIENRSGRLWQTARIIMRGEDARYPAQLFEVENWRIDGRARLSYRFPESEVQARLGRLRILSVSGDSISSPLLEGRSLPAGVATRESMEDDSVVRVETVEIGETVTFHADFEFSLQGMPPLEREFTLPELPSGAEALGGRARELHAMGLGIEAILDELVILVNENGFRAARGTEAFSAKVAELVATRDAYDGMAIDLMVDASRVDNLAVARLMSRVDDMNTALFHKIEDFTRQSAAVERGFRLEDAARGPRLED